MGDRMNKDPYADYRAHLLQRALEEKKRMEMDGVQRAAQQSSALQALRCYSPGTPNSVLWSDRGHRWEKVGERPRVDHSQQSLPPLLSSQELTFGSPFKKSASDIEASVHLQPTRIPSPPFLLDHIDNEDEFLYGKSDSSPVYQTPAHPASSCPVQSPKSSKKESSGWSDDDDDFSPRQSDLFKTKLDHLHSQEKVTAKDISLPGIMCKNSGGRSEPNGTEASRSSSFDIFEDSSPEFLKSKFNDNKELSKRQPQVGESQKKNDFFGLLSSSSSAPKPAIPDIATLLKNLKQIQRLQKVEPKGSSQSEGNDDMLDHVTPQPFVPIKNQITLNLKSKKLSGKRDTEVLPTQKESTSKPQLSKSTSSQSTAALLVSQFLQKLSAKRGTMEVSPNKDIGSKLMSSPQVQGFRKNDKGKPSMPINKKSEVESSRECLNSMPLKRSRSPEQPVLEYRDSKAAEMVQKKHRGESGNDEQIREVGKQKSNIKEGTIHGILKVKSQNFNLEQHSFDKSHSGNSSDRSPARRSLDRSPRRQSHDRSSRRHSRSPKRRSPDRSPRRRSRSRKRRSSERSPQRRSRSHKRRSPDVRSPRRKSRGRSPKHRSRSRKRQSIDSPERQPQDRSPQKGSCDQSPKRQVRGGSGQSSDKNTEKIIANKASSQSVYENSHGRALLSKSSSPLSLEQRPDSAQKPETQKDVRSGGSSPLIVPLSPKVIHCEDSPKWKGYSERLAKMMELSDARKMQLSTSSSTSKEMNIKHDSCNYSETVVPAVGGTSDDKSVTSNEVSKKKIVKKTAKTEPTSSVLKTVEPTDSVCTSSEPAAASGQPIQSVLTPVAQTPAPAPVESYAQYPGASMQTYPPSYQPSPYGEVVDPSAYSYYANALPYTPYSGYNYDVYAAQYPVENPLQLVNYSDYYAETAVPQNQIPVLNPSPTPEEKYVPKKLLPKKEFRRKACLVQVDSSHSASKKDEDRAAKRAKTEDKIENPGDDKFEKDRGEDKIEIDRREDKIEKDRNEDKIGKRQKSEDKVIEKKDKGKDRIEKKDKREGKIDKDKTPPEDAITPEDEKELLSRKAEIKKQVENLNNEYMRMSKLQGEMMRKMRREKDGHKDHIITAYGRLQDEIKVQLAGLLGAIRDIDKELGEKVRAGKGHSKKLSAVRKERLLGKVIEDIPENSEFYDPGGHWCQNCNKLTTTAYDMLSHLKSDEHKEHMDSLDKPWFQKSLKKIRNRTEVDINKSYPIKGVQFIMPVDGFYCSLCKLAFPDSDVAEDHIVGKEHNAAYKKLVAENPVYERRRILDRLAGVAVIQKEENKRRSEAEKELANKRKKQEEELSKRKEANKKKEQKFTTKVEVKNKEEKLENTVMSKIDLEAEKKNAIKQALLEGKKSKSKDRSSDESRPKQTVVYIGRAPNYKPRIPRNSDSKSHIGNESKKETSKDSHVTSSHEYHTSQKTRKDMFSKDSVVNSSHEDSLRQKEIRNDDDSGKDLLVTKLHEGNSNQKEEQSRDSNRNLLSLPTDSDETTPETMNADSEKGRSDGDKRDAVKRAGRSFTLAPAVDMSAEKRENSNQMNTFTGKMMVCDISLPSDIGKIAEQSKSPPESVAACSSSSNRSSCSAKNLVSFELRKKQSDSVRSPTKNVAGNAPLKDATRKAVHVRGPLTEEETDLLLLGINKDDQLPLAVPKPPPSVVAGKSNLSSSTKEISSKSKPDVVRSKNVSNTKTESTTTNSATSSASHTPQQDNPPKPKEDNAFLEELAKKAKEYAEYAENVSTQSSLSYYPSLQGLPYFPYQLFYYYPTLQGGRSPQENAAQLANLNYSGALSTRAQADNSLLSLASQIPSVQSTTTTQAGTVPHISVNCLPAVQDDTPAKSSLVFSPSVQTTTAVQANILQKASTNTVEAVISQNPNSSTVHENVSHEFSSTSVQADSSQKQSAASSANIQSISGSKETVSLLPDVNFTVLQTDFSVPPPVKHTADEQSNPVIQGSVQKPDINFLEKQGVSQGEVSVSCLGTVTATSHSVKLGSDFQSLQENVQIISAQQGNAAPSATNNYTTKDHNDVVVQCNVFQSQPGMNHANSQNVQSDQQENVCQQQFTPSRQSASTVPANFSVPPPSKHNADAQTSPRQQQNATHPPAANHSLNMTHSGNQSISSVQGNISQGNTNIQNFPVVQGSVLHPPAANYVTTSPQTNSPVLGNISQPPPAISYATNKNTLSVQRSAAPFPVAIFSSNAPNNSAVPRNISQPPPNLNYPRHQNTPVAQGSVSQQPGVNYNPAIPGVPSQENVPHRPVHYPPNVPGNSVVPPDISQPPPNIGHHGNQHVPGNISHPPPNINLSGNLCAPAVPGNVSQPPPAVNHPSVCAPPSPRAIAKPPPNISHLGNHCAPPSPRAIAKPPPNISHLGNHCAPPMLRNIPHPPPHVYHARNQPAPAVLGNVSQPPPNMNHPGNQHAPAMLGNVSRPPPNLSHQHAAVVLGNVSHPPPSMNHPAPSVRGNVPQPPGLLNAIPGQVNMLPPLAKYPPANEPVNPLMQSHIYHPNIHRNALATHVNSALPPSPIISHMQNHPGGISHPPGQNCPPGTYSKPSGNTNSPLLPTPNLKVRPLLQENMQPPCMPCTPPRNSRPPPGNAFQQQTRCGAPTIHYSPAVKGSPPAVNSNQISAPVVGNIANSRSADTRMRSACPSATVTKSKTNSSGPGNATQQQQSKNCSDVQSNEQDVLLQSVSDDQDSQVINPVSVASPSHSTAGFHPAPPGTEPVAAWWSSQEDPKSTVGLKDNAGCDTPNSRHPEFHSEKVEPHLPADTEMNSAEPHNSDSVQTQVDCIEKPLVLTTVPNLSCGQPETDTATGVPCPVKPSGGELLEASVDKSEKMHHSAAVTVSGTDNNRRALNNESNINDSTIFHDHENSNASSSGSTIPSAFVKGKSKTSGPGNVTLQSSDGTDEQKLSLLSIRSPVPDAKDSDITHSQDACNPHKLPLSFGTLHSSGENSSDSPPASVASSFGCRLPRHVPSQHNTVNFSLAPPGTEPVTDLTIPHLTCQEDLKSSSVHNESSQGTSCENKPESVYGVVEPNLKINVEATKQLTATTPTFTHQRDDFAKQYKSAVPNISLCSGPSEVGNKDYEAQVARSDSKNDGCVTCPTKSELTIGRVNKSAQSELNDKKQISTSELCPDSDKIGDSLVRNMGSQNCGNSGDSSTAPKNRAQDKMCSNAQNSEGISHFLNAQNEKAVPLSQGDSISHSRKSWFQGPLFQMHSASPVRVTSSLPETRKRSVTLGCDYVNPAPPGTEPVADFQPCGTAYYGMQKSAQGHSENASQNASSGQVPESTLGRDVQMQINVTRESDVPASVSPLDSCAEKTLASTTVTDLKMSPRPQEIKDELCSDSKKQSEATPVSRPVELNTDKANKNEAVNISSSTDIAELNDKEHANAPETTAYGNPESTKSSHCSDLAQPQDAVKEPGNAMKDQNKNYSDVHVARCAPHQPSINFFHNPQVNTGMQSTQSSIVHGFPPWFQAASDQVRSSSPCPVSVPSSFHGTFAKHRYAPPSSDFLNPAPPGTEPVTGYQPRRLQHHINQKSTSELKSGIRQFPSTKFPQSVSEKVEPSLELDLQTTEESSASAYISAQLPSNSALVSNENQVQCNELNSCAQSHSLELSLKSTDDSYVASSAGEGSSLSSSCVPTNFLSTHNVSDSELQNNHLNVNISHRNDYGTLHGASSEIRPERKSICANEEIVKEKCEHSAHVFEKPSNQYSDGTDCDGKTLMALQGNQMISSAVSDIFSPVVGNHGTSSPESCEGNVHDRVPQTSNEHKQSGLTSSPMPTELPENLPVVASNMPPTEVSSVKDPIPVSTRFSSSDFSDPAVVEETWRRCISGRSDHAMGTEFKGTEVESYPRERLESETQYLNVQLGDNSLDHPCESNPSTIKAAQECDESKVPVSTSIAGSLEAVEGFEGSS